MPWLARRFSAGDKFGWKSDSDAGGRAHGFASMMRFASKKS